MPLYLYVVCVYLKQDYLVKTKYPFQMQLLFAIIVLNWSTSSDLHTHNNTYKVTSIHIIVITQYS